MNCTDTTIRKQTALVVQKNGQYLSRVEMVTGRIVWDPHLSNAWKTRDRKLAQLMTEAFGGKLMLFNPIIWEVREFHE